ncbi:MAG: hypothetical protein R3F61_27420 [Myxococcota bacterium]
MIAMLLGVAWAGCGDDLPKPADQQSVVWISPLRKTVSAGRSVRVVPVSALRKAASGSTMSVGRLLQLLGEQKKARNPRRPWKVTVFEASSGALCRPIEGAEPSAFVAGLPVCVAGQSRASRNSTGCGTTVDRASGKDGVVLFRARWRDLAPQGFCVLPAERFVAELAR